MNNRQNYQGDDSREYNSDAESPRPSRSQESHWDANRYGNGKRFGGDSNYPSRNYNDQSRRSDFRDEAPRDYSTDDGRMTLSHRSQERARQASGAQWEAPARDYSESYGAGGRDNSFDRSYNSRDWQDGRNQYRGSDYGSYGQKQWGPSDTRSSGQRLDSSWNVGRDLGLWQDFKDNVKSFFGKGPKGYKRSDERIKEDVSEALTQHWDVDASDIEVTVQEGEVTLSGTVTERRMKRIVEEAVETCLGVKDVHNQLRVSSTTQTDAWGSVQTKKTSPRPLNS